MSWENKIRRVGADKAELLTSIHRACFPHYWNVDAFNDFFSIQGTYALLVHLQSPPACGGTQGGTFPPPTPPAGGRGEAIGMMVYRVQGEQADIITIAVLPEYRRQGLALALMEHATTHMQQLGVTSLFLDVEDGNTAAITLYEGLGFDFRRRRKLYYRQKDGSYTDALVMSKKIA